MEFIALILFFATILLQLVDEVNHPIHLHSFYTLPCEVYDESSDLRQMVLSDDIARYKLTI
jgi:hypothetical protein